MFQQEHLKQVKNIVSAKKKKKNVTYREPNGKCGTEKHQITINKGKKKLNSKCRG